MRSSCQFDLHTFQIPDALPTWLQSQTFSKAQRPPASKHRFFKTDAGYAWLTLLSILFKHECFTNIFTLLAKAIFSLSCRYPYERLVSPAAAGFKAKLRTPRANQAACDRIARKMSKFFVKISRSGADLRPIIIILDSSKCSVCPQTTLSRHNQRIANNSTQQESHRSL